MRIRRTNQHIDGEGLVGNGTLHFRQGIRVVRSVEMERHAGGNTCFVGITYDLEVIILVEVVTGDGFVEAE